MHNKIKYRLLPFLILLLTANVIFSQSYYNSPNDTLISDVTLEHTAVMNITQQHSKDDTIYFKWQRLSTSIPVSWDAYLCDNGHCYTTLPDSGTMIPIIPGDNGLMLIHCTPYVNFGKAIIRYILFATNSSSKIDTLTWIINSNTSTLNHKIMTENPKIYFEGTNLSVENLNEDFKTICVYDINSKVIFKSYINQTSMIYPFTPLNCGVYYIQLTGINKIFNQKIFYNN
ncbi:MAG: T9SS type A sorting domain-containing protein [bacterium]|nr:T9SS type A sorting domain-containing protein [bacterium]